MNKWRKGVSDSGHNEAWAKSRMEEVSVFRGLHGPGCWVHMQMYLEKGWGRTWCLQGYVCPVQELQTIRCHCRILNTAGPWLKTFP